MKPTIPYLDRFTTPPYAFVVFIGTGINYVDCWQDANPETFGKMLTKHYSSEKEARNLCNSGDIVKLGESVNESKRFGVAGHDGISPFWIRQSALRAGVEYLYVFDEGAWTCERLTPMMVDLADTTNKGE